jgi:hypothetical protein
LLSALKEAKRKPRRWNMNSRPDALESITAKFRCDLAHDIISSPKHGTLIYPNGSEGGIFHNLVGCYLY